MKKLKSLDQYSTCKAGSTIKNNKAYYLLSTFIIAILFEITHFTYISIVHPDTPFMDSLRTLTYYDKIKKGEITLLSTWYQGDHRGLAPQVFVYFNSDIFGLNIYVATLLTGVVATFTGLFLARNIYQTLFEKSLAQTICTPYLYSVVVITAFIALFSWANWEVYIVDVGAVLFLKNLIFILYWYALGAFLSGKETRKLAIALILTAPAIVLTLAYGWSYPFVLSCLLCLFGFPIASQDRSVPRLRWAIAASLIGSIMLYIILGDLVGNHASFDPGQPASAANVALSFAYGVSSVFFGVDVMEFYKLPIWLHVAITSVLLALAFVTLQLRRSTSLAGSSMLPFALMFYGGLDTIIVAYARGRFEPINAAASRYFMDLSFFVVGILWASAIVVQNTTLSPSNLNRKIRGLVLSLSIISISAFVAGQGMTISREYAIAPYRHEYFVKLRDITLRGNVSDEDAAALQSDLPTAAAGVEVQRKYALGPFRH